MTETPPEEPRLSDRELRRQFDADTRVVREVTRKARKGTATGRDHRKRLEAGRRAIATRDELGRRAADDAARSSAWTFSRRGHPMRRARELDGRVLDGVKLDHKLLTDEEVAELRKLMKVRHREATHEQDTRYDELIGKAAGEVGLFARRRDEITKEDEVRAEAARLTRAFLPKRRDPEPGSIELPRFLFSWLTDSRPDTFDLTDLGLLAGLAYCFANESADLFVRATFEHADDGPRIVVAKGSSDGVSLTYGPTTRSACRYGRTWRTSSGISGSMSRSSGA